MILTTTILAEIQRGLGIDRNRNTPNASGGTQKHFPRQRVASKDLLVISFDVLRGNPIENRLVFVFTERHKRRFVLKADYSCAVSSHAHRGQGKTFPEPQISKKATPRAVGRRDHGQGTWQRAQGRLCALRTISNIERTPQAK